MAKHNKQHDARAASFRRIAKQLRADAKAAADPAETRVLKTLAKAHDAEAKNLRSMR